jgi:hypothetical protein
VLIEKKFM